MIDVAWAQTAPRTPGMLDMLIPMMLVLLVFYFLLFRPQQRKAKEHETMLANLKKNDEVITSGGLYGRVVSLDNKIVTLEIAKNVHVRVSRPQISTVVTMPRPEEKKKES